MRSLSRRGSRPSIGGSKERGARAGRSGSSAKSSSRSVLALLLAFGALAARGAAAGPLRQEPAPVTPNPLTPEELEQYELQLRRGDHAGVEREVAEILAENPVDLGALVLRARCRQRACDYSGALEDGRAVLDAARALGPKAALAASGLRLWLELATELGRAQAGLTEVGAARAWLRPDQDPRDALALGSALAETGALTEGRDHFRRGLEAGAELGVSGVLARARCERALGLIERAARSLVHADELAKQGVGPDPDVLVELGEVYFEAYGEVEDPVSKAHSPAELVREALAIAPEHEGALLLLFRLHRWNWQRTSRSPDQILTDVFTARPDSIDGLVARASAALDDGELKNAREALARLAELAPGRRDVRTEQAALAWIEHRRDEARARLDELLGTEKNDAQPELAVGWHLLELYRFAEALDFCRRATERDPRDWMAWIQLGRALANTGDEAAAREALTRSVEAGGGRRNAWRDNTRLVLQRMADTMVLADHGSLRFLWRPEEGAVLASYLPDFYGRAREELAARYGHTPGVTQIEIFQRWKDFSVRSTGFEGYPALGVCFGPVVTAVSPLCELRSTFSWARTSFHEFTHVIHLGLSNNRCPRWITEGLATWEEGERRKSWWRNMRRELVDARANGAIFPLRRLNNAFRGPSVLFAYYQSGLLCQMLVERHGFPPMVRLLEAFDRGADLDQAFEQVFAETPEGIDRAFAAFVEERVAGLSIEPRWSPARTLERRFRLKREPPADASARAAWAEEWARVAWGWYGQGKPDDAAEALRLAALAGDLPARGEFLRGELALARGEAEDAMAAFRAGFERGGEDYRARMALGSLLARRGKGAEARLEFEAAERAFPGFADAHFSAELEQARLHERAGDTALAMAARLRWLDWNAGDYVLRMRVAEWLAREGRQAEAVRLFEEANEVDPFRRHLHHSWGRSLAALGRPAEALREFEVGLRITQELDGDVLSNVEPELPLEEVLERTGLTREEWDRLSPGEQAERMQSASSAVEGDDQATSRALARFVAEEPLLHGESALAAVALGREADARAAIERALALDPACVPALEAEKRLE